MKIALLVGASAALALAQPRVQVEKRYNAARDIVEEHVSVTVVECWLGDVKLSSDECQFGIKNGTLKYMADGSSNGQTSTQIITVPEAKKTTFSSQYVPPPSSSSSSVLQKQVPTPTPSSSPTTSSVAAPVVASPVAAPSVQAPVQAAVKATTNNAMAGVNAPFPDGQIDCGTFPSDYGAVALDWLDIGGWASVQKPGVTNGAGYDQILGVTRAQCTGAGCCLEGSFCSYACAPGYLKFQWPSVQGATGQSVGGLLCKGGKLYKTNPNVQTLCGLGTQQVQVFVKNTMSQSVAVCRTNYPGDEKMSIPVDAQPGTTRPLACPDGSNYYNWQGKPTSAQYYINPAGYSVEKACVWGDQGDDFGNWAPGNLGVGFSAGRAWLSIMANLPTQPKSLDYTVELVGDATSDTCRYKNGQYCSGPTYGNCNTQGCTVSAASGNVYYVLSN